MRDRAYLQQRLCAAIALLQPGIDPLFLALLSHHNAIAPEMHGLIVGTSQAGMAAGAVACVLLRRVSRLLLFVAAVGAVVASLLTAIAPGLTAIIVIRALFGLCNGLLYASAASAAARHDPAHALGTIFLFQLLIASGVALVVPALGAAAGSGIALAALAVAALANVALAGAAADAGARELPAEPAATTAPNAAFTATAAGVFLFVAASMMVWSYVGAEALGAGLGDRTIGLGVALGSLAGVAAAWLVAHRPALLPATVAALAAAIAMAAPLLPIAGAGSFLAAMILFNLGATYAVPRFSALAIDRNGSATARRLIPALHSIAMIVGPVAAAVAVQTRGFAALAMLASATLLAAVLALLGAAALERNGKPPARIAAAQQEFSQGG